MAFDPSSFDSNLKKTFNSIAEDWAKESAKLIEKDIRERLAKQVGAKGERMPKKKQPKRSKNPHLFLVDTGESMKMDVTRSGPGHYKIQARRPEILTYPNPYKGTDIFWGIPDYLVIDLNKLLKEVVKRWLHQ